MGKYLIATLALVIALSIGLSLSQEDDQQNGDQQMEDQQMQDQQMQDQQMQNQRAQQNATQNNSITAENQELTNNTVAISRAMIDKPGWIAIHNVLDGRLGGIVGFARLDQGMRNNIRVPVDANATTENLVAELHYDMGTIGCFEYPGADVEAKRNGQPVIAPFGVTIGQQLQQQIQQQRQQIQQQIQQGGAQIVGQAQQLMGGQNQTMQQNQTMDQSQMMQQNQTMQNETMQNQTMQNQAINT